MAMRLIAEDVRYRRDPIYRGTVKFPNYSSHGKWWYWLGLTLPGINLFTVGIILHHFLHRSQ
jgi:hypothetical protein